MSKPSQSETIARFKEQLSKATKVQDGNTRLAELEKLKKEVDAPLAEKDRRFINIFAVGIPLLAAVGTGGSAVYVGLTAGVAIPTLAKSALLTGAFSGFITGAASVRVLVAVEIAKGIVNDAAKLLPEGIEKKLQQGWRKLIGPPSYANQLRDIQKELENLIDKEMGHPTVELSRATEGQCFFIQKRELKDHFEKSSTNNHPITKSAFSRVSFPARFS